MRGVIPLKSGSKISSTPKEPISKPQNPRVYEYALSDFIAEPVEGESVISWCLPGLAAQQLRDLKQGRLRIEARVDLHGLNTEEARNLLTQFIHNQKKEQRRHVLIIHGKGGHQGQPPVIKNLINRWLPQFQEVLAFHSALPRDGGTGAVYVLLKRTHSARD